MRVLHFASTYLPVPGGTTTRIRNMIADASNEHVVYVPRPTPPQSPESIVPLPETETFGHVRVRRVEFQRWPLLRNLPVIGHHFRAREFVRLAAGERPDVLHGHNPMACALAAVRYRQRYGTPLVYEVHGIMQDNCNPPAWAGHFAAPLLKQVRQRIAAREQRILHAADRLIAQTESAKRRLMGLYGLADKPIDVIRNGVDSEHFDPHRWADQREPLRREHGWGERTVCLYAGYLDHVNGLAFLLGALPHLGRAARQRLKFVLAGRGPLEEAVQRAAAAEPELIQYMGMVSYDQMPRLYAASDVLIIPRPANPPAETFLPMKLLEALAMARPALVSDVAAMAEVVRDGHNGLTFRKDDRDDFLRQLTGLCGPDELRRLGQQARADVVRHYTWAASRQKLHASYAAAAAAGRAPRTEHNSG